MTQIDIRERLNDGLDQLLTCSEHGDYLRIRTPYLYPDDDSIDLFCKSEGDAVVVTDLGETVRWLGMQTVSPRLTTRHRALIKDVCLTYSVEFHSVTLLARSKPADQLSVVMRVAQAALQISGQ